jgi:hypothetical protein
MSIIYLNGYSQEVSTLEFCEEELTKSIHALLQDDKSNVISDSYNLASYKMAYNMREVKNTGKTLEKFIKEKAKYIKGKDRQKLIQRVSALYKKFGKSKDLSKITKIIEGLDDHSYFPASKRLSNEESSVILLAFKEMHKCSDICINESDAAVTWFMDQVSNKVKAIQSNSSRTNLMQMTVKIAHLNGALGTKEAIDEFKLREEIFKIQGRVQDKINKQKDQFFENFSQCKDLLANKCFQEVVKNIFPKALSKILEEVQENQITGIDSKLKVKLINGTVINLRDPLRALLKDKEPEIDENFNEFPSSVNLPAEFVTGEKGPAMCGGSKFVPKISNIQLWSFDPLRIVSNAKNVGNKEKELGLISAICEAAKAGPIGFHCYTFLKKFVLRRKTADATVCCKDKVESKEMVNLFASIGGGAEIKAYLGVPLLRKFGVVAEVGLMGGASLGFSVGGGGVPEGCTTKNCIQAAIRTSLYLGGYIEVGLNKSKKLNNKALDALNKADISPGALANNLQKNKKGSDFSLVGGELKLSFKPYITGRQCLYPTGSLPPAEVKLSLGSVWMHGTIHFGWMFSKDLYKLVYKNDVEDNFSIPIF